LSHELRLLIAAFLVGTVAVACSPGFVFDRPELENCVPDTVVSLPIVQAPAESRSESQAGVDCFEQSVDSGQPIEIQIILIGTEGEPYEAVLQHVDGHFNLYRETDEGSIGSEMCSSLDWPEPGIPDVSGCQVELP
jgi:hypothetical protein